MKENILYINYYWKLFVYNVCIEKIVLLERLNMCNIIKTGNTSHSY